MIITMMIIMLLMMLYNDNSNNKNVILVDWMSVCAFRRPLSDADFWYKVLKFGLTGQPRSRKLYFVSTLWYARKLVHATTAEGEKKSGIGAGRFSREKKNILIHTHTHTHTHKHTKEDGSRVLGRGSGKLKEERSTAWHCWTIHLRRRGTRRQTSVR